jgi:hypothetical protein
MELLSLTFLIASAVIHPAISVKQVKPGDDVGGITSPLSSELVAGVGELPFPGRVSVPDTVSSVREERV